MAQSATHMSCNGAIGFKIFQHNNNSRWHKDWQKFRAIMKQLASYVLSLFQELFWPKFQTRGLRGLVDSETIASPKIEPSPTKHSQNGETT